MEAGTQEVEAGTVLAEQTGAAFAQIEDVFRAVTDRVNGICAAAQR
jgi:methyl-accepting chemotaxis protein